MFIVMCLRHLRTIIRTAFLLSAWLWLTWSVPASAGIWHVRADAPYSGTGAPWNPFPAIQQGVDRAFPGDTVLVHQGTYYESVHTVRSGVDSTDGRIYYLYFVAAGDGPALIKSRYDHAFFVFPDHDYVWIEGFHITEAFTDTTAHGAAIRTHGSHGVFIRNHLYDNSMGIFSEGYYALLEVENNRDNYIAHNIISDSREAGIRLKHSSENEVAFNLLYHNGHDGGQGGAVTYYCGLGNRIVNNTFWNNFGPAVRVYNGTDSQFCIASALSEVENNIFARPDSGLLFEVQEKTARDTTSVYSHNLFWGPDSSDPVIAWGRTEFNQGGWFLTVAQFVDLSDTINVRMGRGTFFADPRFQDPWLLEFDLLAGSPAIDAGSVTAILAGADSLTALVTQELDAGPVDLGYHHPPEIYQVNPFLDPDPAIVLYPNPYSGGGGVHFTLPNSANPRRITGAFYDIQGRKVAAFRLPDEPFNHFLLPWEASHLASGMYILRLNVDGSISHNRILLLK